MKNIFIALFLVFVFSALTGCAVVDKIQDQSSEKLSELIVKYCNQTDEWFREEFRKKINDKMKGLATIKIKCG